MIAGFTFWSLSVDLHWPVWLSVLVVLFVEAPLMGLIIERVLMRPLSRAGVDVTLTITLGLLLFLVGLATLIWDPETARVVPAFFASTSVGIGGIQVSGQEIMVVATAAVVAIVLRLFLYRTRMGTTLRGVVDNRELVALSGASPVRYAQLGWVIGSILAAVAGILLAADGHSRHHDTDPARDQRLRGGDGGTTAKSPPDLRRRPGPRPGAGLPGRIPAGRSFLTQLQPVVPMVFLFAALLIFPERRIELRSPSLRMPRVASGWESAGGAIVFVGFVWLVSGWLSQANQETAAHGIAVGLVMLSLVLLTGYGGQVSLCQLTFAGLGAFAMGRVAGGDSWIGSAGRGRPVSRRRRLGRLACASSAGPLPCPGDPGVRVRPWITASSRTARPGAERRDPDRAADALRAVDAIRPGVPRLHQRRIRPVRRWHPAAFAVRSTGVGSSPWRAVPPRR